MLRLVFTTGWTLAAGVMTEKNEIEVMLVSLTRF